MSKQKSNGKAILIATCLLLAVAALVGGSIAISKSMKDKASSNIPNTTAVSSSEKTNPRTSESSAGSSSSLSSSSNQEQHENTIPTINCSTPQEVYWYNTEDQAELNETLLVATINGLPANATDEDRELYFWSDDDDLDEWMELYVMKNGNKVVLNSPYTFNSGDTIHVKQIKKAPATGFYKIPLWIYAVNYEPEDVFNCVDFWFIQR